MYYAAPRRTKIYYDVPRCTGTYHNVSTDLVLKPKGWIAKKCYRHDVHERKLTLNEIRYEEFRRVHGNARGKPGWPTGIRTTAGWLFYFSLVLRVSSWPSPLLIKKFTEFACLVSCFAMAAKARSPKERGQAEPLQWHIIGPLHGIKNIWETLKQQST